MEGANTGGVTPPPPTRVCNAPPCKTAGSVSVGLGLLSFPPIAVDMHHGAFETTDTKAQMGFFRVGGRPLRQHASAMYLRMKGGEAFLLAPGSVAFPSIAF